MMSNRGPVMISLIDLEGPVHMHTVRATAYLKSIKSPEVLIGSVAGDIWLPSVHADVNCTALNGQIIAEKIIGNAHHLDARCALKLRAIYGERLAGCSRGLDCGSVVI